MAAGIGSSSSSSSALRHRRSKSESDTAPLNGGSGSDEEDGVDYRLELEKLRRLSGKASPRFPFHTLHHTPSHTHHTPTSRTRHHHSLALAPCSL
jgi:hypothetical protein